MGTTYFRFCELFDRFEKIHSSKYKNVDDYASEFITCTGELADLGCTLPDPYITMKFVNGLGPKVLHLMSVRVGVENIVPAPGQHTISFGEMVQKARKAEENVPIVEEQWAEWQRERQRVLEILAEWQSERQKVSEVVPQRQRLSQPQQKRRRQRQRRGSSKAKTTKHALFHCHHAM